MIDVYPTTLSFCHTCIKHACGRFLEHDWTCDVGRCANLQHTHLVCLPSWMHAVIWMTPSSTNQLNHAVPSPTLVTIWMTHSCRNTLVPTLMHSHRANYHLRLTLMHYHPANEHRVLHYHPANEHRVCTTIQRTSIASADS